MAAGGTGVIKGKFFRERDEAWLSVAGNNNSNDFPLGTGPTERGRIGVLLIQLTEIHTASAQEGLYADILCGVRGIDPAAALADALVHRLNGSRGMEMLFWYCPVLLSAVARWAWG